jgi:hypothetical protein
MRQHFAAKYSAFCTVPAAISGGDNLYPFSWPVVLPALVPPQVAGGYDQILLTFNGDQTRPTFYDSGIVMTSGSKRYR